MKLKCFVEISLLLLLRRNWANEVFQAICFGGLSNNQPSFSTLPL